MWVSAVARSTLLNSTVLQPNCIQILPVKGVTYESRLRLKPDGGGDPAGGAGPEGLIASLRPPASAGVLCHAPSGCTTESHCSHYHDGSRVRAGSARGRWALLGRC